MSASTSIYIFMYIHVPKSSEIGSLQVFHPFDTLIKSVSEMTMSLSR